MSTNWNSAVVRQNIRYSVLDYLSQPAMMILTAPLLLRSLGAKEYGAWILVNSITATAGGLGGGFGDSATKFISAYRGRSDKAGVSRALAGALAINVVLGSLLASVLVVSSPLLIDHVFQIDPVLRQDAIAALRISAFVLLVRFVSAVFTAAVRAYERYRPVIVTSISSRIVIMASAVVIAGQGCGLVRILWATLAIEAGSLIVQAIVACTVIKFCIQALVVEHNAIRALVSFGVFTWLKSAISVLFGYLDRLMVAAFLGADPLAFYVLCAQLTQVVPSVMGAGLNFVFPNFSARTAVGDWEECRRDYRKAATVAAGLAAGVSGTLIATAHIILTVWLGPGAAAKYSNLLIAMTIGNGLLAVSVVPHYTALAFGRSRELALMNLAAGLASGIVAFVLLHRVGLIGGGLARILAGLVSLLAFAIVTSVFKKFDLNISPENDTKSLAVGFAVDPR